MPLRALGCLSLVVGAVTIVASEAQAQSCSELWYRRNSIYKQAGYCFKTARAIQTFGNAGCSYDSEYDIPLSARQRGIVAAIREQERDQGCPR